MKQELKFTTGQFARLHHLNKRTLHYYDEIGLFSPAHKGENGYRYYTYRQSAELENILALREVGMSIEEMLTYLKRPNAAGFQRIAAQKISEIDAQVRKLAGVKTLLRQKCEALAACEEIFHGKLQVRRFEAEALLLTPLRESDADIAEMEALMEHLCRAWEYSGHKIGCGSYISFEKVRQGEFDIYDGLFTPVDADAKGADIEHRPAGEYLCGYCVGSWEGIPAVYGQMLKYAEEHGLKLSGRCYETGLNEFAIADESEYVTQIKIPLCVENM